MAKKDETLLNYEGMTKEQAIEAIKNKGFANIAKEEIKSFLTTFEKGENRDWIKEAYKPYTKAKVVYVLDKDGNKIETGKTDKDGNPKYKKKRVEVKGGTQNRRYNHNKAKTLFFKRIGLDTKSSKAEEEKDWEEEFNEFWN